MKSPRSMRNGRFDTPWCRGKVQRIEVFYTHPQKKPRPLQHARAYKFFLKKIPKKKVKKRPRPICTSSGLRLAGDC
jgi:hypothetical protein